MNSKIVWPQTFPKNSFAASFEGTFEVGGIKHTNVLIVHPISKGNFIDLVKAVEFIKRYFEIHGEKIDKNYLSFLLQNIMWN